ncbi:MAG: maleylacetoacetate isomerase [Sphingomonas sp.]|jgi:maleylacetoacetate isomerase|uniref:maleylacetoacetate isomerase n=1 Tax=Sphingomonas sp. TaxID=28214 RepID=UPI0035655462
MIKLYDYWRSSAAYRVRIALNLKRVPYESQDVALLEGVHRAPENLARNPQGFVPTLEVDGEPITQSLAIIDYLDALYPDPPMVPRDPLARARVLAQALVIAADIHPINNLRILKRLESQFGADQAAKDDWYRHWIIEGFTALEQLAEAGAGPLLGGDKPNLADVCLVPQMFNARRFKIPLEAFPRLVAADAAANAIAEIAAAQPDRVRPAA